MARDIESFVFSEIQQIQKKNGSGKQPLKKSTRLFGGGTSLDSLDVAELIVRLEKKFGTDPFRNRSDSKAIRTLGDLAAYYECHAEKTKKAR